MEINASSKLFDVLKHFPELEDKLISIAPPFQNLKNPVLRKTVGKIATIEKIAHIGNLEVIELVNLLRSEVGQPEISATVETKVQWQEGEPDWIKEEPKHIIDGTEMLSQGIHPLQKVNQLMKEINQDQFLLLKTNFKPIPLIDEMKKQSYQVYSKTVENQADQYLTFIRK